MKKIVYFIRHSQALKPNNDFNEESLQLQNEKWPLSIEGEKLAQSKLINDELKDLDLIVSSNYVRTIATAKYLTVNNDKEILVLPNFGERKFGINNWNELPKGFELKQWEDEEYKLPNGECLKKVRERCYNELMNLLNKDYKRIAIVFHATAMLSLLKIWCNMSLNANNQIEIEFNNKIITMSKINNCDTFKLEFNDNNELLNIERIDINE